MAAPASFTGFAKDAMQFWHELASEMSREWFAQNKQRYEDTWVKPTTLLLEEIAAKLAAAYRPKKLGAPRVLRIQRDLRFSKDKSPYKTWIGAGLPVGERKPNEGVTALYLHFGVEHELVGAGQYVFADETLAKWRKLVAGPKGAALARLLGRLQKGGYTLGAYETLARVPRDVAADHPRAELLRMKGLVVAFPDVPRGLIHKAAFREWLVGHARAVAPVSKWLATHLG